MVYEILATSDPYEPEFTVLIVSSEELAKEVCARGLSESCGTWKYNYGPLNYRETKVVSSLDEIPNLNDSKS